MKILLLVPPISIIHSPLLAVPSLSAYLKSKKIDVVTFDANLEFYYYTLNEKNILTGRQLVKEKWSELKGKKNLTYLDNAKLYQYQTLLQTPESIINEDIIFGRDGKTSYNIRLHALQAALTAVTTPFTSEVIEVGSDVNYVSYTNDKFDKYSTNDLIESIKCPGIFDGFFVEIFVPLLRKEKPDIVGISVSFEHQIHAAFLCARIIRETIPDVHITLGGTFVSSCMVNMSNIKVFNLFDSLVIGDGEIPLENLSKELESEKPDVSNVPGLFYYDGNRINKNPPASLIPLENLPFPDFSGYLLGRYIFPVNGQSPFTFRTSRGCYWKKCRFCSIEPDFLGYYMHCSPEYIFEGINHIREKTGGSYIYFTDSAASSELLSDLSRILIAKKVTNFKWTISLRADKNVTLERCMQLSSAGCSTISLGLETFSDRLLKDINKGTDIKTINRALSNLSWAGIYTLASFIVGLPTETEGEAIKSHRKVIELQKKGLINKTLFNSLVLCPLSEFYKNPEKYGIYDMKIPEEWDLDGPISDFKVRGMTRQKAQELALLFNES